MIPQELHYRFMIIYSFQLSKFLMKTKNFVGAARMLMRVIDNIDYFPDSKINIYTSTFFACHQSGLESAAYKWATKLNEP